MSKKTIKNNKKLYLNITIYWSFHFRRVFYSGIWLHNVTGQQTCQQLLKQLIYKFKKLPMK